eukprot:CAMPEP_0172444556 /NCGR_PEP_ID=MMETSP1065-20121228/4579_1 /TAXON_ID=265537 /ORGANISM="Amphiprora paludosa, Strain CCMP125" /LENGTH=64 /DNA_ID=CAMNT_0013195129 /DNA_START=88 /DNA_END=278 /DNA_ORIENTATION=+
MLCCPRNKKRQISPEEDARNAEPHPLDVDLRFSTELQRLVRQEREAKAQKRNGSHWWSNWVKCR